MTWVRYVMAVQHAPRIALREPGRPLDPRRPELGEERGDLSSPPLLIGRP